MTRAASPRLEGLTLLVALGLVASLALRRPELAAIAAPFGLLVALGLRAGGDMPRVEASFSAS